MRRDRRAISVAQRAGRAPQWHVDDRLVECDYGDWTGQPLKTLAKEPLWKVVQTHPSAALFPGGESMAAMSARAVAAVRDWDGAAGRRTRSGSRAATAT